MPKKRSSASGKLPLQLYRKVVSSMPICCVDAVFISGKKVFLFKRAYHTAKGEWWLVGGRVLKGETLRQAIARKAKEETGVDVAVRKVIGTYEIFFGRSRYDTPKSTKGAHTIAVCFVVEPKQKDFKFKLNDEYTECMPISRIEKGLHPYVRKVLKDSGVFSR